MSQKESVSIQGQLKLKQALPDLPVLGYHDSLKAWQVCHNSGLNGLQAAKKVLSTHNITTSTGKVRNNPGSFASMAKAEIIEGALLRADPTVTKNKPHVHVYKPRTTIADKQLEEISKILSLSMTDNNLKIKAIKAVVTEQ